MKDILDNKESNFFSMEVTAYLKDVNIYGTGYFSRYFEWQGMAREEYFMTVENYEEVMRSGIKLITKKAWIDYIAHCYVFDKITLKIQNKNIRKFSFEMLFTYINTKTQQIIAQGGQTLVFMDHNSKLIKIPNPILNVIAKHKIL